MKIISFVAMLFVVYIVLCLLLFIFQRKIIYFPSSEVSVEGMKHYTLNNEEVKIKVWVLNPNQDKALIYFGGNAENVAYNMDSFMSLFTDYTVYLVNYRGYGGSSGTPSEIGFYDDALAVYDDVVKQHKDISVMGRSIGSAVATYLASQRQVLKVVLIAPMDSIINVAKKHYAFFPVELLLKERFDSLSRVGDIKSETLIVATKDDEVVSYENSKNLAKAFRDVELQFVSLSSVGHNSVHLHPGYKKIIRDFMTTKVKHQ